MNFEFISSTLAVFSAIFESHVSLRVSVHVLKNWVILNVKQPQPVSALVLKTCSCD